MTKADFSRALGVGTQHYNNWRHQGFPSARLVPATEVLEVNLEWLAKGAGAISRYHQTVGERIAIARKRKHWTINELEKALGLGTSSTKVTMTGIQAIEAGKQIDIEPELAVYAAVLSVAKSWLEGKETNDMVELPNLTVVEDKGEITIPQLSAIAAMGRGIPADLEHDTVVTRVSVNNRWIRENLAMISSPTNLAMITGQGDSMEGTFNSGDVLFVDTGINDIKVDAVYVFNLNGDLYIKRLQRNLDGSVVMISDNHRYQPITISRNKQLIILGRIVGIWNFRRV